MLLRLEPHSHKTRVKTDCIGLVIGHFRNQTRRIRPYLALRRTQISWRSGESNADWASWLVFFLRSLRQQITRLEQRIDAGRAVLSPLASQLATLFEQRETLTLAQAEKALGANRSTLKAKFRELVGHGMIDARGKGRGAFYARK